MGEMHDIRMGEMYGIVFFSSKLQNYIGQCKKYGTDNMMMNMQQNNLPILLHLSDVVEATFGYHTECDGETHQAIQHATR